MKRIICVLLLFCNVLFSQNEIDTSDFKRHRNIITDQTFFIKLNPTNPYAYSKRAFSRAKLGDIEGAILDFSEAIEILPNEPTNYLYRAQMYVEVKTNDLAVKDYSKLLKLKPDLIDTYLDRGNIFLELKNYSDALKDYNKYIELKPEESWGYYNRGIVYGKQDKFEKELSDYNKAIELNPSFYQAYGNRANLKCMKLKDYKSALEDYNYALKFQFTSYELYFGRSYAYYGLGEFDNAIQDLHKVIEIQPGFDKALFNLANVYFDSNKMHEALEYYSKFIRTNSELPEAYEARAKTYIALKREKEGNDDVKKAQDLRKK